MIRHVQQEHTNGCAIAAVAMIAGLSYTEALRRLGPGVEARITKPNGGFWIDATLMALQRLGFATAIETRGEWGFPRPDWKPQPIGDVNIAEVTTAAGGHMIVVLRDGTVLDPATATPRRLDDYNVNWIAATVPLQEAA